MVFEQQLEGFCFCFGTRDTNILYDGVNQGMLCEFIEAMIIHPYVDTS